MKTLDLRFPFQQIQILDREKDNFINEQIQYTCSKYTELTTAVTITKKKKKQKKNHLRCRTVLWKKKESIPMSKLPAEQL